MPTSTSSAPRMTLSTGGPEVPLGSPSSELFSTICLYSLNKRFAQTMCAALGWSFLSFTCKNEIVEHVRMARGEIPYNASSSVPFALDALAKLRFHGYENATLSFEYLCTECKQIFPIHFGVHGSSKVPHRVDFTRLFGNRGATCRYFS